MCDRILVVHEGEMKEQGAYEELMALNGVFPQLASGSEWSGVVVSFLDYSLSFNSIFAHPFYCTIIT
jgi:hypothetical protein